MRYTTAIDITELPQVYRNVNARLLYLHMTLKCGYHDDDRDLLDASIRTLAADVGITIAATRHALVVLERAHLVSKEGAKWRVTKWLMSPEVTKRVGKKKSQEAAQDATLARQFEQEAEDNMRRMDEAIRRMSTQELRQWVAELRRGESEYHGRWKLKVHPKNIEYLQHIIESR